MLYLSQSVEGRVDVIAFKLLDEVPEGRQSLATPVSETFNPSIDYARFVAAVMVLIFHAGYLGAIGSQLPVAFFTIILVFLTLRSRSVRSGGLASRMGRLIRPWAVWCIIYGLVQILKGLLEHRSPWPFLRDWLPPGGTQGQLWFLPFAALVTLGLFALPRQRLRTRPQSLALPAVLAAVGLGLIGPTGHLPETPILTVYTLFLPSVAVGVLFYGLHQRRDRLLAAAAGLGFFGAVLWSFGLPDTIPFTLAAPIAALALCFPLPSLPGARALGALSMDIYLNHILALAVVNVLLSLTTREPGGLLVAIGLSIAGGLVTSRLSFGHWLR